MTPIDTTIQPHAVTLISIVLAFGIGFFLGELSAANRRAKRDAAAQDRELANVAARYESMRDTRRYLRNATDAERRAIPSRMGADGIPAAERIGVAKANPTYPVALNRGEWTYPDTVSGQPLNLIVKAQS